MSKPEKAGFRERRREGATHAGLVDLSAPNRLPIPKSKNERPASKGRVHKGRTRS